MNPQAYQQLSAAIADLERDPLLCQPDNFVERIRAMDFLELQLMDDDESADDTTRMLAGRARTLKNRLDEANEALFAHLLAGIQAGDRAAFRQVMHSVKAQIPAENEDADVGYDEIDALVNGLLEVPLAPGEPGPLEPDMIYYQPTPARIVLRLLDDLCPTGADVFYDLGSGLGHVPILVNLLTDIPAKGIEIEASYYRYALERLKKLCLSQVEFVNADARRAACDDGTIFYLYTPFRGEILRQVLGKLEAVSHLRAIRLCTYGPVTAQVSRQPWLEATYQSGSDETSLGIFRSR
jgi:hypothetical protein